MVFMAFPHPVLKCSGNVNSLFLEELKIARWKFNILLIFIILYRTKKLIIVYIYVLTKTYKYFQKYLSQDDPAEHGVLVSDFHFQIHKRQLVCAHMKTIICPKTSRESVEMYKMNCQIIMIIITDKCICPEFEVINVITKSPTTSASLAKKNCYDN